MNISFITYQTEKLRPQRIIVKTTHKSDLLWYSIFSVIVSYETKLELQFLFMRNPLAQKWHLFKFPSENEARRQNDKSLNNLSVKTNTTFHDWKISIIG